jgi:hypothetical protein
MKVLLSHIADSERKMIGAIEPLRDCRNMVTGGSPQSSLAKGFLGTFSLFQHLTKNGDSHEIITFSHILSKKNNQEKGIWTLFHC